jgi:nitrite reductase/ring-hydroxylating ferredoxin subunit
MDEPVTTTEEWQDFCSLEEIPDGGILTRVQGGAGLLVYRNGTEVTCMPNYCPHRGYAFDGGEVRNGVLSCPYHGYEFRLDTGECLTWSAMSHDMYPVRIRDGRVEVRLK